MQAVFRNLEEKETIQQMDQNKIQQSFFNEENLNEEDEIDPDFTEEDLTEVKSLKDPELHLNLKSLVKCERKITHKILLHIMEVDLRKLHLRKAYPSLWEYLVKGIGYSAPSAQRRIDAARLMIQVPDLGQKLEEGKVNMSQVSQLQRTLREVKKQNNQKVTAEEKQKLIQSLENKSKSETDQILSEAFKIEPKVQETKKTQKDKSVRVEITFTEQEAEMLEWAQAQLSHSLSRQSESMDMKGLMLYCVRRVIKSKTGYQR